MGQKENLEQLLKLHSIITGKTQGIEQITSQRTIDPDFSLIHNTELSGKVAYGRKVSIKDYYTLGDQLDIGSAAEA
jgi:hypothetical protein